MWQTLDDIAFDQEGHKKQEKKQKKVPQTEEEIKMLKPEEQMKYEIALELGLFDKVQAVGWKGLSSRETGKIGGLLATRKKQKHVDT